MSKMPFPHFGMEFVRQVFTEARLKKELDKSLVQTVPVATAQAVGSASIGACSVKHLPQEGNPQTERVFDVFVPFTMALKVNVLVVQETYSVAGQVRMRLWVEAYPPLRFYLNGAPVPPEEVSLVAAGVGNWLNADIAKKFNLEGELRKNLAKQFTEDFAKSQHTRWIDILQQVNQAG